VTEHKERIRVAFDLEHERQSDAGVTRSARALVSALTARTDVDLLPLGGGLLLERGTLRKRLTTLRQDFWWYPLAGRRSARRAHAEVYHCPTPRAPIMRGRPPTVVTIHDLASYRFPETLTRWTRYYERATLRRIAESADRITVPSTDTADDVRQMLRIGAERIRVVPPGVDFDFFSAAAGPRPFPFRYVLFVGTPQPRKNLARLADAVQLISRTGQELRLVVAGTGGWGDVRLDSPGVVFAGRATQEELRALYRHADCLALVSLHEGFGMPVLEAMAAGTPVVASDVAALPETAGGAAVLVDPMNVEAIARGIQEALDRKENLVAAGTRRAGACAWTTTADLTVRVYEEIR